jgi:hypothetical protein
MNMQVRKKKAGVVMKLGINEIPFTNHSLTYKEDTTHTTKSPIGEEQLQG